jgi:hypothetical protein
VSEAAACEAFRAAPTAVGYALGPLAAIRRLRWDDEVIGVAADAGLDTGRASEPSGGPIITTIPITTIPIATGIQPTVTRAMAILAAAIQTDIPVSLRMKGQWWDPATAGLTVTGKMTAVSTLGANNSGRV